MNISQLQFQILCKLYHTGNINYNADDTIAEFDVAPDKYKLALIELERQGMIDIKSPTGELGNGLAAWRCVNLTEIGQKWCEENLAE